MEILGITNLTSFIIIGVCGYGAVCINIYGITAELHVKKALFTIGATLLIFPSVYPQVDWVLFSSQATAIVAVWFTFFEIKEKCRLIAVIIGTAIGAILALVFQSGILTYVGILGLAAIALGFISVPEPEGRQNLYMAIGGALMVVYSAIAVFGGSMQALPWLILNIPFAIFAIIQRQRLL